MNAAGQVLVEFLLLTILFLMLIAGISKEIPLTFSKATPFLGFNIQTALETGHAFSLKPGGAPAWSAPVSPKGGLKDKP